MKILQGSLLSNMMFTALNTLLSLSLSLKILPHNRKTEVCVCVFVRYQLELKEDYTKRTEMLAENEKRNKGLNVEM